MKFFLFCRLHLQLIIIVSKPIKLKVRRLIAIHLYKFKKNTSIFSLPLNLVELLTKDSSINIVKTKKLTTIKFASITSKIIDFEQDDLIALIR